MLGAELDRYRLLAAQLSRSPQLKRPTALLNLLLVLSDVTGPSQFALPAEVLAGPGHDFRQGSSSAAGALLQQPAQVHACHGRLLEEDEAIVEEALWAMQGLGAGRGRDLAGARARAGGVGRAALERSSQLGARYLELAGRVETLAAGAAGLVVQAVAAHLRGTLAAYLAGVASLARERPSLLRLLLAMRLLSCSQPHHYPTFPQGAGAATAPGGRHAGGGGRRRPRQRRGSARYVRHHWHGLTCCLQDVYAAASRPARPACGPSTPTSYALLRCPSSVTCRAGCCKASRCPVHIMVPRSVL